MFRPIDFQPRDRRGARARRRLSIRQLQVTLGLSLGASWALAAPNGGVIVGGSGSIDGTAGQQVITQHSERLAIDWQQFSLAAGERTEFRQPGASSVALNRVLGGAASEIHGQLVANGQVFLVNPHGVLFGKTAQVDVGGLVASTLDLSADDFMAGKSTFTGNGGSIENQGRLTAADGGYVALIAAQVVNSGSVQAHRGTVALAAGEQVSLKFDADSLVAVTVDRAALDALVDNRQALRADGGTVLMTARARDALLDTVVNNDGVIEADTVGEHAGVILLGGGDAGVVASRGALLARGDAGGGQGGRVEITGQRIALTHAGEIDVSGEHGGGRVNIGGSREGQGPLPNSAGVFISRDARVTANARTRGDGGALIVHALDTAQIHGTLEAKGGALGGDGGFVETSGRQHLDLTATPLVTAAAGAPGLWLIDPVNLVITATSNVCVLASGCVAGPDWQATGSGATVGVNLINAALNAGQNVTLTTGASGAQAGDITFSGTPTITKSAGAADVTLTMRAHNDVALTRPIAHSGAATGRLNVVMNGDIDNSGAGSVSLRSTVSTGGGTLRVDGVSVTTLNSISTAGTAGRNGGDVQITARPTGFVNMTSGSLVTSGGTATAAGTDAGDVSISGGTVIARAITASGGNAVGANQAGGAGGNLNLDATGANPQLSLAGNFTARGGNGNGTGAGGAGGAFALTDRVTLSANVAINTTEGTGGGASGGAVSMGAVDSTTGARRSFAIAAGNGSVQLGDLGALSPLGAVNLAGTGGISGGNITTSGLPNANGAAVTVNAGAIGAVTLGAVTTRGGTASGVGRAGGAVNVSGRTVAAGEINTSGTSAIAGAGGAGGAVALTVSGANADLSLTRNVTTNGGNGVGAAGGASGALTITGPVTLRNDISLVSARGTGTSNGTAGTIAFNSAATTINSDATPRSLNLLGNGIVRLLGPVGQIQPLDDLNVQAGAGVALPAARLLGDLRVATLGPVTDAGALRIAGVTAIDAGASAITLDDAGNDFTGAFSARTTTGTVTVNAASSLLLGSVSGSGNLTATATGDITIDAGATLTSSGGNVVLVARGGNFINDSAAALSTPAGRWLVYATSPAGNRANGLAPGNAQPNLYNRSFAANPPATIAAGNHFLFTFQPTLTVTPDALGKFFGNADPALSFGATGLLAGDALADAFTGSLQRAAGEVPGGYAITPRTATSALGYAISVAPGTFTIDRRPITVTADPRSKIFGDAEPALGFSLSGGTLAAVPGGALTGALARSPGETVGGYAINQGTLANPNYAISFVANDFVIAPRALTLGANAQNRVYGDADPVFGFNVLNGVLVGTPDGALSGAPTRAPGEDVGRYAITQGTLGNPNYALSFVPGSLDITPRALALTGGAAAKTYGDADPSLPFAVTGGVLVALPGGALNGAPARAPGEGVGRYEINLGSLANSNYSLSFVPGSFDIVPRPLAVRANDVARLVGTPNPAFSASFSGFAFGEDISALGGTLDFLTPAVVASAPGAYRISPSGLTALNYAISFADGTLTVSDVVPPVVPPPGVTPALPPVDAPSLVTPVAPPASAPAAALITARQPEPPADPGVAGLARLEVIDGGIRLPPEVR